MEINKLLVIAKDIVFNENEKTDQRLSGVRVLIEDCCLSILKKQKGLERLYATEKRLVIKLIEEYKESRMIEFMKKYGEITTPTPEMVVEMSRIDKPTHCYMVEGNTVIESDCNFCKRRICEKKIEE